MNKIGLLLTNTGTPDAPKAKAVRRYLREFLSDKRVVQIPRIIWLPILYGIILTLRPRWSAKLYQKIWTSEGSPLRVNMEKLAARLERFLNKKNSTEQFIIEIGMNYGNPNIPHALENLRRQQVDKILVLPLYPQYSNTTTQSSFDRIKNSTKNWSHVPEIYFIQDYAEHPDYIQALATNIQNVWSKEGKSEHLLISFHGVPERFIENGDPYLTRCERTAKLLVEKMQLPEDTWTLCFQSRFGYARWLTPSTQVLLAEFPKQGIKQIDVVCPGFPVDCLETLEEIAIRGKETFLEAGGKSLRYLSALNASELQIDMLTKVIQNPLSRHQKGE